MEAIMQAISSASPLGKREDQTQSGALVINYHPEHAKEEKIRPAIQQKKTAQWAVFWFF
jgi:hypothetical protein